MKKEEENIQPDSPFRQHALEYINVSRTLDDIIQVTSPLSWLILFTVWIILATIILWTIFGSIEVRVSGPGLLLSENQKIESIFSPQTGGYIRNTSVYLGDLVKENQVVAELYNPELESEIQTTKDYIKNLQNQYLKLLEQAKIAIASSQDALNHQKQETENTIRASEKKVSELEILLNIQEAAFKKGITTIIELTRIRVDYLAASQDLQNQKKSLFDYSIAERNYEENWKEQLRTLNLKIIEQQNKLQNFLGKLQVSTKIRSPVTGIITSVQIKPGDFLAQGTVAFQIATLSKGVETWVYIPAEDGKRVTKGMRAHVSPSTIRVLEFGNIIGEVTFVDHLPSTPESMQNILKNKSLVDTFLKSGPVIMVRIKLLQNLHNPSGLQWTSSNGPSYHVTAGTLVKADMMTEKQSPLSLVLPFLKKVSGE